MQMNHVKMLAEKLILTAQNAGRAEMEIYQQGFTVERKSDDSPVTQADRLAEAIILRDLSEIAPDIPVVAEEAASEGHIPQITDRFFLVDPLDGTKEFIKKSHEFTVNIALIEKGQPVFGLVYAPALKQLYITLANDQAAKAELDAFGPIRPMEELDLQPIRTRKPPQNGLTVVASKSHMTDETRAYIEQFKVAHLQSAGSSLKFCLLASGEADLYPRFGPTMEWDTAAGHAVLNAAGGEVVMENQAPLSYGKTKDGFLNPSFICRAERKENTNRQNPQDGKTNDGYK